MTAEHSFPQAVADLDSGFQNQYSQPATERYWLAATCKNATKVSKNVWGRWEIQQANTAVASINPGAPTNSDEETQTTGGRKSKRRRTNIGR